MFVELTVGVNLRSHECKISQVGAKLEGWEVALELNALLHSKLHLALHNIYNLYSNRIDSPSSNDVKRIKNLLQSKAAKFSRKSFYVRLLKSYNMLCYLSYNLLCCLC